MSYQHLFVLAGTSGTGKTMLLEALSDRGYSTHSEVTRAVLEEQVALDGEALPSKNPECFIEELLRLSIVNHQKAMTHHGPVWFDRGMPDVVAYAERFGVDTTPYRQAANDYRYNPVCFLLPPWREIYTKDAWRGGEFEFYQAFHETIQEAYLTLGYRFIDVPKTSVDRRADFVVNHLKQLQRELP